MQFAFQDYDNLYLIMDLLNGGDLRYHISRYKRFSEEQTSNFILTKVFSIF
jgi:serine/threonine protein kinase